MLLTALIFFALFTMQLLKIPMEYIKILYIKNSSGLHRNCTEYNKPNLSRLIIFSHTSKSFLIYCFHIPVMNRMYKLNIYDDCCSNNKNLKNFISEPEK